MEVIYHFLVLYLESGFFFAVDLVRGLKCVDSLPQINILGLNALDLGGALARNDRRLLEVFQLEALSVEKNV